MDPQAPPATKSVKDYALLWTPGTDQLALCHKQYLSRCEPVDANGKRFPASGLGCWFHYATMTFEQRKMMVFIEAYHLIVADRCDPAAVHRTLWPLKEYRDGLAEDFPDPTPPKPHQR